MVHPGKGVYVFGVLFCFVVMRALANNPFISVQSTPITQVMRWTVDGTIREAMVYLPATAKIQATPIVFAFHGHGGNMQNMFRSHGFAQLWPEAIIVCPQGLNTPGKLTDPEGTLPGWQKVPGDQNDRDLHFFDAMLKTFRQDYKVDDHRVYVTGHSNGGTFTYLLWAMRGDMIAAVAPSGAVAAGVVNLLKPKPAIHIMGENDPLVKPVWQKAMCERVLRLNNCSHQGENYAVNATLYPSSTGNPLVLYVYPGGHVYPQEANAVVIKFFKGIVKP